MGFRTTGKKTVEVSIEEKFCDSCEKSIPDSYYPDISIEAQYEWSEIETHNFCSLRCAAKWATEQTKDNLCECGRSWYDAQIVLVYGGTGDSVLNTGRLRCHCGRETQQSQAL